MAHQARPVIGINADFIPPGPITDGQFVLNCGYVDTLLSVGGLPLILPPLSEEDGSRTKELEAMLDLVDGVVLSGGMDLDPKRKGLPTHPSVRVMPARREQHDQNLLNLICKQRKPLLAVGAGMQMLNVTFGGSLFLNLPTDMPRALPHRDETGEPHRHIVLVEPGTQFEDIYGTDELRVNSEHHQAVDEVAEGFQVGARAPDGVIEAIEWTEPDWFCIGTQWHPESSTATALDLQLFDAFLQACAQQTVTLQIAA